MTNKTYSIKNITPKRFKDKLLTLEATNPRQAEDKMFKFIYNIKPCVKVKEKPNE